MNILVFNRGGFAERQYNAHARRVSAAGGIIQDGDAITRRYELYGKLGIFPRRDYSALGGVLLNGQSVTNLVLRSQEFDNASWVNLNTSESANSIISPDGSATADKIQEVPTGGSDFYRIRQSITTVISTVYTASFYFKSAERTFVTVRPDNIDAYVCFNLSNGTITTTGTAASSVTSRTQNIGNGWYRCIVTYTATGTGNTPEIYIASAANTIQYAGTLDSGIYIWGAQLQTGTIATDYIPTGAATASATQSYVQTLYDLNNTSPVDAVQSTAANQPYWGLDTDTGFRVPLFDGSNDFMSVNDLGIFNAQPAGTMISVAKDLNRTGGDATHTAVFITTALGNARASLSTRAGSTSVFRVTGRRLDADSSVSSSATSADGYNCLSGLWVWGGNVLEGIYNGVAAPTANFSSGAGTTSATNSTIFRIGAEDASTNRLNGYIAELPIFRTALSATQIQAIRNLFKRNYRTLP